uniref:Uncharacterized protein n=1 Tax=Arundo donax TaxID=35708 RepID=A0A0A9A6V2_ARUDO
MICTFSSHFSATINEAFCN